ncbi:MAG: hypothetical protein ACYDEP_13905 [Acidimicrobiales bacterium]
MDDETFDLDLLAGSLRADSGDVRILLRVLVEKLSDALGSRLTVERSGGRFFKKPGELQKITVELGDDQLIACVVSDRLECTVSRSSGGIRIRSEKVPTEEWIRRLLSALRDEASTSEATRTALESIVIGDGT